MEFDITSGEKAVKVQLRAALVNARYGLSQAVEAVRVRNHVVSVDGVVDLKDVYEKLDAQIDALTDHEAIAAEKARKEAIAEQKEALRKEAESKAIELEVARTKQIEEQREKAMVDAQERRVKADEARAEVKKIIAARSEKKAGKK